MTTEKKQYPIILRESGTWKLVLTLVAIALFVTPLALFVIVAVAGSFLDAGDKLFGAIILLVLVVFLAFLLYWCIRLWFSVSGRLKGTFRVLIDEKQLSYATRKLKFDVPRSEIEHIKQVYRHGELSRTATNLMSFVSNEDVEGDIDEKIILIATKSPVLVQTASVFGWKHAEMTEIRFPNTVYPKKVTLFSILLSEFNYLNNQEGKDPVV